MRTSSTKRDRDVDGTNPSAMRVAAVAVAGALAPAALVLAAALLAAGCSRDRSGERAVPASPQHFESVDAFLDSRAARPQGKKRVVVIGVDAAGWEFLDPLIEKGTLPNFARIKREGAWGRLRSTACYVTPPGWTAMFSGALPERTGIYTFGTWDRRAHQFFNIISDDVVVPRVWDVATRAGRRVGVVNVPVTYPATPVNGLMISGMMTPNEPVAQIALVGKRSRFTDAIPPDPSITSYSPIQRAASGDTLNTIIWMVYDTSDNGVRDYNRVSVTVVPEDPMSAPMDDWALYSFDIGEISPWVKIRVLRDGEPVDGWCRLGMDRAGNTVASATFLRIDGPYTYPPELAGELEREFGYYLPSKFVSADLLPYITYDQARQAVSLLDREDWDLFIDVFTESDNVHHVVGYAPPAPEVYRAIDRTLGVMMDRLGEDGLLIVASDHGTKRFDYGIDLNQFFAAKGFVKWKSDGVIDFDRTLVFHNLWHLYFNHDLLAPDVLARHGVEVGPGEAPAAALSRHLVELGKTLTGDDGRPMPVEFSPIPAGAAGNPPDMTVRGTYGDYTVVFWNFKTPQERVVDRLHGKDQWCHQLDGMIMAWGKGIRANYDIGTTGIENVGPTILYALGLPVAEDLDGTVIDGLFETERLARQPRYLVPDYAGVATPQATSTGREDLENKLRSLGYIQH